MLSIFLNVGYVKANSKYLYEEAIFQKDTYLKNKSQNFNIIFHDGADPYSYNNISKYLHVYIHLFYLVFVHSF